MAYADRMAGSRRVATFGGVALVHGVLGYLFVSGMAVEVLRTANRVLETTNVPISKPPEPEPLPKPEPLKSRPAKPTPRTSITFVDRSTVPAANTRVDVDVAPFTLPTFDLGPVAPPARPDPVPSKARGVGVRGDRAAWITNADYPNSALAAEEQGRVGISLQIGADGRVTQCSVTESSGSSTLDAVTCRLYRNRARFDPARDDAGSPIASRYSDRVRWQLPRE